MRLVYCCAVWLSVLTGLARADAPADVPNAFFPKIAGWEVQEEPTVYTRDNLWELIDGAADLFVSYAFEDLRVAEYRSPGNVDVRIELYRHASRDMAFGMYAAERSPEFAFLPVGTQGYIEDGLLNFLLGNFYAKISSHVPGKAGRDAMLLVGGELATHLKQQAGWPEVLALFPPTGRLPNAEGMIASNYLGYSFFQSAYTCKYDSSRGAQAFIIACAGSGEAEALFSKYLVHVQAGPSKATQGTIVVNDPNLGSLGMAWRGRYVAGVLPPSGGAVPAALLSQLDTALANATEKH